MSFSWKFLLLVLDISIFLLNFSFLDDLKAHFHEITQFLSGTDLQNFFRHQLDDFYV